MLARFKATINSLNSQEQRSFYIAFIFLILSLALLGLNYFYENTKTVPKKGGEYIEGFVGQPSIINPILITNNDIDRDLIALFFSNLNILKEKIESLDRGQTWTITLKKNLKWIYKLAINRPIRLPIKYDKRESILG